MADETKRGYGDFARRPSRSPRVAADRPSEPEDLLDQPAHVLDAINESVLFIGLTSEEKRALAAFAEPVSAPAGECIVREGAPGDALFLLASGTVDVVTGEGTPREKLITSLSGGSSLQAGYAGAFFGEMALIDIEPRSATVRAQSDVQLIKFAAPKLRDYYIAHRDAHLTMITNIARSLSRRLRLITDLV